MFGLSNVYLQILCVFALIIDHFQFKKEKKTTLVNNSTISYVMIRTCLPVLVMLSDHTRIWVYLTVLNFAWDWHIRRDSSPETRVSKTWVSCFTENKVYTFFLQQKKFQTLKLVFDEILDHILSKISAPMALKLRFSTFSRLRSVF